MTYPHVVTGCVGLSVRFSLSRPESALALEVRRLFHVWEEMPYPRCFQHLGGMTENKDNARQWHDDKVPVVSYPHQTL